MKKSQQDPTNKYKHPALRNIRKAAAQPVSQLLVSSPMRSTPRQLSITRALSCHLGVAVEQPLDNLFHSTPRRRMHDVFARLVV